MSEYKWVKIDTAAIMFSSLSTKTWGRTFRYSAYLKSDIVPELLKQACLELMPYYPAIYAYLKRGFFWNYLALTDSLPEIREENEEGMLPVVMRGDGKPDFRLTYKENRLNIECSHSLGDGKGIMVYFKALLTRYNELCHGKTGEYESEEDTEENITNAFSDYYDRGEKAKGDPDRAFHFPEKYEENYLKLLFAEMSSQKVKELAHREKMTVTEYLCAVLMLGIIRSQKEGITEPVTIAVPVNLRRFFPTMSVRNFTVQTFITFCPDGRRGVTLSEILDGTRGQLKAQLKKEELQKKINKYGSLVNNPVIKVVPNVITQPVMRMLQRKTHAGVTTIFTNYGACNLPDSLAQDTEKLQFVNGDTRRYGLAVTCSCISRGDTLSLCYSAANRDTSWYDACLKIFEEKGISVSTQVIEGHGENKNNKEKSFKEKLSKEKIKAYFNM